MATTTESAPMPGPDAIIHLTACSTDFHVRRSALTEASTYFKALFAPHMFGLAGPTRAPNGAIIVLADPAAFRHIITYAQHKTFPLFYEQKSGFDLGRYAEVYHLAKSYGVNKLASWINEKKYVDVFKLALYHKDVTHEQYSEFKSAYDREEALGKPKRSEGVEEIIGGSLVKYEGTQTLRRRQFEIDSDALVDTS